MGFPVKNTGMGCHALLLPDLGIKSGSPALKADFLQSEPPLLKYVSAQEEHIKLKIKRW